MKIGFSGTGGVGKTTAATTLSQRYGWTLPPSAARTVLKEWGITEAQQAGMTKAELWDLQMGIWAERQRQEDYYTSIGEETIWDRTLLDHLGYAMLRAGASITQEIYPTLEQRVLDNLATYDLFVFFPKPRWQPAVDEMRDPAEGFRCIHHFALLGFLTEWVPNFISVPPEAHATKEGTVDFLVGQIKRKGLLF